MTDCIALEMKNICKQFPGVKALDNVSFELKKGEVHALVGENGAGKSTLVQTLNGVHKQDSGEIVLDGKVVNIHNPLDAQKHGIGIVFQELSLIPELSVAENVFANRQPTNGLSFINRKKLNMMTQELIDLFEEKIDPNTPVKYLTVAKQQMVEIMKALSHHPKVLVLDEPTASLTNAEKEVLFRTIKKLKENGVSIIYISHHFSEIFELTDRVTVLRDGKYIATLNTADVDEDRLVVMMVGREITHKKVDRKEKIDFNTPVLEVKGLSHLYSFKDISFTVHKGEILSFSGLIGAGRSEVARTIFGLDKKTAGEVYLNGKLLNIKNPSQAIKYGIAYASENRKLDGLFLNMTVEDNCIVPQLQNFDNAIGFMQNASTTEYSDVCVDRYNISTPSIKQMVRNLSGGNQQKILLSMWTGIDPKVLIVDEPTKGVDVGAKAEIYDHLRALADSGIAIIVISSDLTEVLSISDRIIVMKDGEIAGSFLQDEATEENIIGCATGVAM